MPNNNNGISLLPKSQMSGTMPDAETFDYANMQKLLSGDLSQLSGGQKLMALGALLRSASRGSQTTPQEVLGTLRQEARDKAVTQLQLAQMQAASAQKQKQQALIQNFAGALQDESQQQALLALGPDEAAKKMAEVAFRPRQVQQIMTDDSGNSRIVFGDGTSGTLDFKVERGRKWIQADPGNTGTTKLLLVDEKTGSPVLDEQGGYQTMAIGSNWAEQQRIAQGWENVTTAKMNAATSAADRAGPGRGSDYSQKQVVGPSGKPVTRYVSRLKSGAYVDTEGRPVKLYGGAITSKWQPTPPPPAGKPRY